MKKVIIAVLALGLSLGSAGVLQGQEDEERIRDLERRLRDLRTEMRELERELRRERGPRVAAPRVLSVVSNRGRLGVVIQTRADRDVDSRGALLTEVIEDGPAYQAGLREGDIVTSFNGESLVEAGRRRRRESGPGLALIEMARELEPGDSVRVEYLRGDDTRSATIVADEMDDLAYAYAFGEGVSVAPQVMVTPSPAGRAVNVFLSAFGTEDWFNMELVRLDDQLGRYFGTSEGLLVVEAPEDDLLGLQSGDVILSIGGRKPRSPERAFRLIRSYEEGETLRLEVMRDQRTVNLEAEVPEREERIRRMEWRQEF